MNISKIMLAAAIAAGFVGGAMAVTTADYVQDGLVGHWDGIDNAGTGTHNPTAAKWKDLTGLTGDGTLASTTIWKDIGWYNNSDGKPVIVGNAFGSTLNTGTFTLEVTIKPSRANTRETILGTYNTGNWNLERNKDNVDGRLRYWFNASPDFVPSNAQLPTGESGTIALAASPSSLVVYKNGIATDTRSGSFTLPQSGVSYVIGGEHNRPAMAFRGNYYSVRLYNRALDADELWLNSAIDQVRLLGRHPSDVACSADRRIDNDLNIVSNRAGAATLVWRGAAGGRWADAANWSLNGEDVDYAPMELDTAVIASGAAPFVDAGQEIRVAAVVYADAAVNPGTYTGSGSWGGEVPWLSGAGVVRIASSAAASTATWTGNGADEKVTTPANWGAADNTVLPDLHGETLTAEFTAGGTALLDDSVTWKGISFASSGAFTFADAAKVLAIGSGGIETELAATPTVRHTFNVPMLLTATQTWFANTNATIEFTKPLSFYNSGDTLTLSGAGQWNFRATSTFPNDITVTGDGLSRRAAHVRAYANNALGGSEGTFKMDLLYGSLVFSGGITNSRTIETYCNVNDQDGGLYVTGASGVTNVFDAPFNHRLTNLHLYIGRGTTFVVNKRFYTQSACYVSLTGSGTEGMRWIVNEPLYIGDRFTWPNNAILELNAPTNRINGNTGSFAGTINLNVPYALSHLNGSGSYTQCIPLNGTGILDLKGNDNGVGVIFTPRANYGGTIRSETPATLHLVDDYLIASYDSGMTDANGNKIAVPGYTNRVAFTGCVSLSKEGKYTNRLIKASSTYGNLTVAKGRLEMAPEGTWANASNLVVKGTGLFTLEEHPASAPAFGKHVVVRIEPGLDEHGANPKARIELLNTTVQRCAEFYVDDVRQSEGLWGSAAAAAANPGLRVHTAPFFTGTGLMQVYSGVGVTLIIR